MRRRRNPPASPKHHLRRHELPVILTHPPTHPPQPGIPPQAPPNPGRGTWAGRRGFGSAPKTTERATGVLRRASGGGKPLHVKKAPPRVRGFARRPVGGRLPPPGGHRPPPPGEPQLGTVVAA